MDNRDRLGTQVSFALYGAANRMVRLHKPLLEPLGLTFPQYLVILDLLDGAPVSVGVLGTRLSMDTGTITPLLQRLDAAGMVTRTRDSNDERRVIVDLTPTGRALEPELLTVTSKIKTACDLNDTLLNELRLTLDALAQPANSSSSISQPRQDAKS